MIGLTKKKLKLRFNRVFTQAIYYNSYRILEYILKNNETIFYEGNISGLFSNLYFRRTTGNNISKKVHSLIMESFRVKQIKFTELTKQIPKTVLDKCKQWAGLK
jgi:hypothetical protein